MKYQPTDKISTHFTYKEALWLPQWGRMAEAKDGLTPAVLATLSHFLKTCMDPVRELFGKPINVHCCYRPEAYNILVKGAARSSHKALVSGVAAMDFDVAGIPCPVAKLLLVPHLARLGVRMEDNGAEASWIHLDNAPVPPGGHRFFKA